MRLKSLRTKFIFYTVLLIILVALAFLLFFISRTNDLIKDELINFGTHLTKDLSRGSALGIASEDPVFLKPSLEGVFEEKDVVMVAVYNRKGVAIALKKRAEFEEEIPKEVMEELLKNKTPITRTAEGEQGKIYIFYAPVLIKDLSSYEAGVQRVGGFTKIAISLERIRRQSMIMWSFGLLITILIIIVAVLASILLARAIVKPINLLTKGVEAIAGGNLRYRIKVKTGDEVEKLAEEFNTMAEKLRVSRERLEETNAMLNAERENLKKSKASLEIKVRDRTQELRRLTESLDEQVKQRTKQLEKGSRELEKKLKELEAFHRLAVGRELEMAKLKKQIKESEKELKKYKTEGK